VRYRRAADQPLGTVSSATVNASISHTASKTLTGSTLYVEWDPMVGVDSYRVEAAWRPEGAWETVTTNGTENITVDTSNRRVIVTGLGVSSSSTGSSGACFSAGGMNCTTRYIRVVPVTGGVDGATSLISPAPKWHWVWEGMPFSIDARPDYGRWTRWVMRYRLSDSGTGYREVWKDDVKVASQFNITFGNANPSQSLYWKIGFYTGYTTKTSTLTNPPIPMDWPWRRTVLFDEIRGAQRVNGGSVPTDTSDSAYQWVRPRGPAGE
jgi:hypothetical protein